MCPGTANDSQNREREVLDLLSIFKWVNSQTLDGDFQSGLSKSVDVRVDEIFLRKAHLVEARGDTDEINRCTRV